MSDEDGQRQRDVHAIAAPLAVAAVILVAFGLRPSLVSVGPILPRVLEDFSLSHAAGSLLTSLPDLLMGIFALPAPWLARRYGRDAVLLLALALLAGSTLGRAFATSIFALLATTVGVGIGIALAGALIAGFIKARFANRAALLMGIYAASLSLGSTIAAAVTGPVAAVAPSGWRLAAGMWSAVVVVGLVGWSLVAVREGRAAASIDAGASREKMPLANRKAWLVALFFGCVNLLFYSVLTWTSAMYQERGIPEGEAGLILATFTGVFTVANPVFGSLSRNEDRRVWLAAGAGLAVLGLIGIAAVPMTAPFLWISIFAFGLGGTFTLGMTLPLDNTQTVDEANAWNAFVLMVGYVIAAAGPLVVGRLRDLTGSFDLAFWGLVGVATSMLLIAPFLQPRRLDTARRPEAAILVKLKNVQGTSRSGRV
ncbi:CP family cyanate transporter-like MFS transporter [Aminobacter niigataensis]|uniref:CP family cyanate transporter-like MFS transporter n=1 Tax=Aminobacter niigataensis TaxID=83265 RepID=A0ABR6L970_9HYPH|nr:MFS transporter [Aminobacter niigataensis]MBB4653367.1 CP family cyanate transporter-like MFS transporter [Aminobacter niigataensis]